MRAPVATGLSLLVMVLAGCAVPEPSPTPDAQVVWDTEGSSPLESDPAVEAARAADLAWALAFNGQDFGRDDFLSTHTEQYADGIYDAFEGTYVRTGSEPRMLPGPSIWLPLSVEERADGSVAVMVCDGSDHWIIEDGMEPSYDLTKGFELTILLESEGGTLRVADEERSVDECDATGAPVGRFDPVPVPPSEITTVVPPH